MTPLSPTTTPFVLSPHLSHTHVRTSWPTTPLLGPLTDAKIHAYMLEGRYGPEVQRQAQRKQEVARKKRKMVKMMKKIKEYYV